MSYKINVIAVRSLNCKSCAFRTNDIIKREKGVTRLDILMSANVRTKNAF